MDFMLSTAMAITGPFGPLTTKVEFGMKTPPAAVEQRIDIGVSSSLNGETGRYFWTATGCWNLSQKGMGFQLKISGKR